MRNHELSLYQFAHAHLTSGSAQKAVDLFHTLTLLQPMSPRYWIGLAEACFLEKSYYQSQKACNIALSFIQLLPKDSQEKIDLQLALELLLSKMQVHICQ
ncbi:MAG: hypothetical protein QRY74_01135 [Chlamydia sp.]